MGRNFVPESGGVKCYGIECTYSQPSENEGWGTLCLGWAGEIKTWATRQEMMNSPGMAWVKTVYWWSGCNGSMQNVTFSTIPAYLTTAQDFSNTAFQVGAFSTDIQDMGNGTVQYTMYNKAGWHSLLGGLNGNLGDHDRQPAFPMNEMNQFGGNIRQIFQWRGPKDCDDHHHPGRK